MTAQLADALLTPGKMVNFFFGRVLHRCAHLRQLGGQGLTLIQRLGTDFAGMVDAHQAGDMARLGGAHLGIGLHDGRRGPVRLAAEGQQRAHGGVGLQQQAVNRRVVTLGSHADLREKSQRPVYRKRGRSVCAQSGGTRSRPAATTLRNRLFQPGGQFIWR
ncbi:hypothetical protein AO260_31025 [Pseudomonas sp. ABAC21]|nr:hypothetical protein AO260_31025 [Pseudomonas sp. ABAC21]